MKRDVYGAFTMMVVVNGQDVTVSCSLCGTLTATTVDRAEAAEARVVAHIADHIWRLSNGVAIPPWTPPALPNG